MALLLAALVAILQAPATTVAPLDARWSIPFDTAPAAAAGFDASTAFVPLKGGQLVAVDLDSGAVRWRLDVATPFTPATGDGLVFTITEATIEARDALTGATRWQAPLPGGAAVPLYWDTGWLLASTPNGDLAAFRAADGQLVWRQALGSALAAAPAPALDRLFLPLADNRLVSVLLATGETTWSRKLGARITGLLALEDQLVFGTTAKDVVSVNLSSGRERWTWRVGGDVSGLPAADEHRIYFAARDNVLRAVDRKNGNLRWNASLPSRPSGSPLPLPNQVLMPLVSKAIAGFDLETGKPTVTVEAAGEIGLQPFFRRDARVTAVRLVTVSRDGHLQGFAQRFEPVPGPLMELPGLPAVP
ncbi:MAG: PQQ-like beta-propeller repeat protein [Acidobacteriota bacterium]|nr:PQQ-like beta-propeller repeat protein [Acidobacteriota bacterium]